MTKIERFINDKIIILYMNNISIEKDFNNIHKLDTAREAYLRYMHSNYKGKELDDIKKLFDNWFDKWYTGNYNNDTGKIILYRFLNLGYKELNRLKNGSDLLPSGYMALGREKLLENKSFEDIIDALEKQNRGEDISDFIVDYAKWSGANKCNIDHFFTVNPEGNLPKARYRITVQLNPNEAWRVGKVKNGEWVGSFDKELEWTVLGSIPNERIKEIYDTKKDRIIYKQH